MPKTTAKVSRAACQIGGNVYCLISTVYNQMYRDHFDKEAEEMSARIDAEANSPEDVLRICQEYVTLF